MDSITSRYDILNQDPLEFYIESVKRKFPHTKRREIGNNFLVTLFPRYLDDGVQSEYKKILLSRYFLNEKYFSERKEQIEKMNGGGHKEILIDPTSIPKTKLYQNTNIKKIFYKEIPRSIYEDKIQFYNYSDAFAIWLSVGIVNILGQLRPSINEISRICLLRYLIGIENEEKYDNLKKIRESQIRFPLSNLTKNNVLDRTKFDKEYYHQISAWTIIDSKNREFSISKDWVEEQYEFMKK